jgi:hypothetical protein
MSLIRALRMGQKPEQFGARQGEKWPPLAVRRFMLYDVFLHELGHLQLIDKDARSVRRKFAHETRAQEFAVYWSDRLWSAAFSHPDPVHNQPAPDELTRLCAAEVSSSKLGAIRADRLAKCAVQAIGLSVARSAGSGRLRGASSKGALLCS